MREVVGQPIKFLGVGESSTPWRSFTRSVCLADLGMGDVLTLIEKPRRPFDADEVKALEKKLRQEAFTLDDFREQLKQIKKMGSMEQIMSIDSGVWVEPSSRL